MSAPSSSWLDSCKNNEFKPSSKPQNYGTDLGADIVDIHIGPAPKPALFRVHKHLICSRVPYFSAMFETGFLETTTQSVEMPEDDPAVFGLFIERLYSENITPSKIQKDPDPSPKDMVLSPESTQEVWTRLQLYAFAEKIVLPELMNYCMSVFITICKTHRILPGPPMIGMVYLGTPPGSRLRKITAEMMHWRLVTLVPDAESIPPHFGRLLAENEELRADFLGCMLLSNGKKIVDPCQTPDKCIYHVHEAGFDTKLCKY